MLPFRFTYPEVTFGRFPIWTLIVVSLLFNHNLRFKPISADTFRMRKDYIEMIKMIKNTEKSTDDPSVLFNYVNEREEKELKEVWGFAPNFKDFVKLEVLVEKFPGIREFQDISEHCEKFRS